MWLLAGLLWILLKVMVFRSAGGAARVDPRFFAWVGMDTAPFCGDRGRGGEPFKSRARPLAFILAALGMVGILAPVLEDPILVGWVGIAAWLYELNRKTDSGPDREAQPTVIQNTVSGNNVYIGRDAHGSVSVRRDEMGE